MISCFSLNIDGLLLNNALLFYYKICIVCICVFFYTILIGFYEKNISDQVCATKTFGSCISAILVSHKQFEIKYEFKIRKNNVINHGF